MASRKVGKRIIAYMNDRLCFACEFHPCLMDCMAMREVPVEVRKALAHRQRELTGACDLTPVEVGQYECPIMGLFHELMEEHDD